jgi:hypothetical protein
MFPKKCNVSSKMHRTLCNWLFHKKTFSALLGGDMGCAASKRNPRKCTSGLALPLVGKVSAGSLTALPFKKQQISLISAPVKLGLQRRRPCASLCQALMPKNEIQQRF